MSLPSPIVYIVDDDRVVCRALSRLLKFNGHAVQAFASGREFLACERLLVPACLILDLNMPEIDGLQVQEELRARRDMLPVIFLTAYGDVSRSVRAFKAGAADFLTKPCDSATLLAAVSRALAQSARWLRKEAERERACVRVRRLTPREHEVFRWIIAGRLNKQIAHVLGTTERTVKAHRGRVMKKLGVTSVAELVWLAERAGIRPAR